jgi:hypothetical protein
LLDLNRDFFVSEINAMVLPIKRWWLGDLKVNLQTH